MDGAGGFGDRRTEAKMDGAGGLQIGGKKQERVEQEGLEMKQ
jgi:hypothetical protein